MANTQHTLTHVHLVFLRRHKSSDTQLQLPMLKYKQSTSTVMSELSNSPVTPVNGESVLLLSGAGRGVFTNPTYSNAQPYSTVLPTPPEVRTHSLLPAEADMSVNVFC